MADKDRRSSNSFIRVGGLFVIVAVLALVLAASAYVVLPFGQPPAGGEPAKIAVRALVDEPPRSTGSLTPAPDANELAAAGARLLKLAKDPADIESALALLRWAEAQGDVGAAFQLGAFYLDGGGNVAPDPDQAERLLVRAADAGHLGARFLIGSELINGRRVKADPPRGAQYLATVATSGNADATRAASILGQTFLSGAAGIEPHPTKALLYLEQASRKDSYAAFLLARALLTGNGLVADPVRGVAQLQALIDANDRVGPAAFELGMYYLAGSAADPVKARASLEQSAAAGFGRAGIVLGRALLRGEGLPADPTEGRRVLEEQMASGGNATAAAFELGDYLLANAGDDAAKQKEARAMLERAVSGGHGAARLLLGRALLTGQGLPADKTAGWQMLNAMIADGENVAGASFELGRYLVGLNNADPKWQAQTRAYLEKATAAGHGYAPILLARALMNGEGVERDEAAAIALLTRVADGGNSGAAGELGRYYLNAKPPQPKLARAYLDKAVAAGDGWSAKSLGRALLYGEGLDADPATGLRLLQAQIDAGDVSGPALEIGLYWLGQGNDPKQARAYLDQAAAAGNPRAMPAIGRALMTGEGLKQNIKAGLTLLQDSAKAGNGEAVVQLARFYVDGAKGYSPNLKRARGYYEAAADAGNAYALIELADVEIQGKAGRPDGASAVRHLNRAIEMGGPDRAVVMLANLYLRAQAGVKRDPAKGLALLEQAAKGGSGNAVRELIFIHTRGIGKFVPKNIGKAREWLDVYKGIAAPDDLRFQTLIVTAAATNTKKTWQDVADLFDGLTPNSRRIAARQLFFVNRNAAVYLAQLMLHDAGLYTGKINGMLTKPTIDALQRSCSSGKAGKCGKPLLTPDTFDFVASNFS
mgnify:CR=1 FL=1